MKTLALLLMLASWDPAQEWSFTPATAGDYPITAYRLYWSNDASVFCDDDYQTRLVKDQREDPRDLTCGLPQCAEDKCCWGKMVPFGGDLVFYQWVAVDTQGNEGPFGLYRHNGVLINRPGTVPCP